MAMFHTPTGTVKMATRLKAGRPRVSDLASPSPGACPAAPQYPERPYVATKKLDRQNRFILYSRAPKTSSYLFLLSQNSDAARTRLAATPGDSSTCLACSCGRRGGEFLLVSTIYQELTEGVAAAAACGFLLCGEFGDGTSHCRYVRRPRVHPQRRAA